MDHKCLPSTIECHPNLANFRFSGDKIIFNMFTNTSFILPDNHYLSCNFPPLLIYYSVYKNPYIKFMK